MALSETSEQRSSWKMTGEDGHAEKAVVVIGSTATVSDTR
jgi:hypothetical protein